MEKNTIKLTIDNWLCSGCGACNAICPKDAITYHFDEIGQLLPQIDNEKCIGCGKCTEDCFPGDIRMRNGKPSAHGLVCMECGHCLAVCPVKAVTLNGYDMSEVSELSQINTSVDPDVYLNHLRSRRSIILLIFSFFLSFNPTF